MISSRFLICLLFLTLSWSCNDNKDEITACGVHDPINDLPWLNEIVTLANDDDTGFYIGTIWLTSYEGQELFVTNMSLGSGGIMYWVFDCNGEHAPVEDIEFYNSLCDCDIIFSNMP